VIREVKRASPLELFFDLVFVFALTQVTVLMADAGDWAGIAEGMLALAAIWWAWAAYAWLTNEVDPRETRVRIAVFAAMIAMLIAALALPDAFENEALLFACAYLAVRVLHIALFAAGTSDVGVQAAVRQLAPPAVAVPAFLIAAAFLEGWAQVAVWILVIAGDFALGGIRGIEGFRLSPAHFAERHGLIVIIALGESIVAIGVALAGVDLGGAELATAGLGVCVAAALWWTYFDRAAEAGERSTCRSTTTQRSRHAGASRSISSRSSPSAAAPASRRAAPLWPAWPPPRCSTRSPSRSTRSGRSRPLRRSRRPWSSRTAVSRARILRTPWEKPDEHVRSR
jgi:low temperature requirement protein LtrA